MRIQTLGHLSAGFFRCFLASETVECFFFFFFSLKREKKCNSYVNVEANASPCGKSGCSQKLGKDTAAVRQPSSPRPRLTLLLAGIFIMLDCNLNKIRFM